MLLYCAHFRFSNYTGYAQTYKWTGDYIDFIERDKWGRKFTELVAIDAHVFHCYGDQFKVPDWWRLCFIRLIFKGTKTISYYY